MREGMRSRVVADCTNTQMILNEAYNLCFVFALEHMTARWLVTSETRSVIARPDTSKSTSVDFLKDHRLGKYQDGHGHR